MLHFFLLFLPPFHVSLQDHQAKLDAKEYLLTAGKRWIASYRSHNGKTHNSSLRTILNFISCKIHHRERKKILFYAQSTMMVLSGQERGGWVRKNKRRKLHFWLLHECVQADCVTAIGKKGSQFSTINEHEINRSMQQTEIRELVICNWMKVRSPIQVQGFQSDHFYR